MLNQAKSRGKKEKFFKKSGSVIIVSFKSNDFLHTQSHIQLSVTVAKFCPFLHHSVLYSFCL